MSSEVIAKGTNDVEAALLPSSSQPRFAMDWKRINKRAKNITGVIWAWQLDPSQKKWGFISWSMGLLMIFVLPILRLLYVRPAADVPTHSLVFQPFTVVIGIAISSISFTFLRRAVWKYDLRGMDYFDHDSEQILQRCKGYHSLLQGGTVKLAKIYTPLLVLYLAQRCWFHVTIRVALLPHLHSKIANICFISIAEGISFMFQTLTYLYACILFWKVCLVQELKMFVFKDLLAFEKEPPFYFEMYTAIGKSLHETSRQFRLFLTLTGFVTIISAFTSLYEVVIHRDGVEPLLSGELLILNLANITGMGVCLKAASKIAHLHRRIVKAASAMHARATFAARISGDEFQDRVDYFCEEHDHWAQRNALVNFLQNNMVGISLYGFVLDRFLVHASIAILLMTTWFILGRSLPN